MRAIRFFVSTGHRLCRRKCRHKVSTAALISVFQSISPINLHFVVGIVVFAVLTTHLDNQTSVSVNLTSLYGMPVILDSYEITIINGPFDVYRLIDNCSLVCLLPAVE